MVDALEIGYAIKDRRAELGLTQAQLAEMAGVSKRCLWSLELGRNPGVQLNKLTAVLGALGLDLVISTADATKTTACSKTDEASDGTDSTSQTAAIVTSDAPTAGEAPMIDAIAILTGARQQ